jgi:hypothetical protein
LKIAGVVGLHHPYITYGEVAVIANYICVVLPFGRAAVIKPTSVVCSTDHP